MESPNTTIQLYIITGVSGAGKSQAIHFFEDAGFFCMDNVPPTLLPKFTQLCQDTQGTITKVAVVMDVRSGRFFESLFETVNAMKKMGILCRILYLEASDEVLIRRFSETRRKHPLSSGGLISEDLQFERRSLSEVRENADFIINTSDMNPRELYEEIQRIITHEAASRLMSLVIVSFGFKHGVPTDSDMIFDVRFLPNPYYVSELKAFSGLDKPVYDFVLNSEIGTEFANRLKNFIEYLIPFYVQEPKSRVQIGIGCTGGRHRSVALTEYLFNEIKNSQTVISRRHRDLVLK